MLGALVNPRFLGLDNITNVLARSTFIATIAVGQTLVITGGGLDLSVGAMAAFVSGLMILFLNSGLIENTDTVDRGGDRRCRSWSARSAGSSTA